MKGRGSVQPEGRAPADDARSGEGEVSLVELKETVGGGSSARTRTWNLAVNSRPLCRLSYRGRPRDYTAPTSSVKTRLRVHRHLAATAAREACPRRCGPASECEPGSSASLADAPAP